MRRHGDQVVDGYLQQAAVVDAVAILVPEYGFASLARSVQYLLTDGPADAHDFAESRSVLRLLTPFDFGIAELILAKEHEVNVGTRRLILLVDCLRLFQLEQEAIVHQVFEGSYRQQVEDRVLESYPTHEELTAAVILRFQRLIVLHELAHLRIELLRNEGVLCARACLCTV